MTKRLSAVTALGLAIFAGQAYAETIQGTVTSVDPDGKSFQVSRVSENGSGSEDVKVNLKDDTQYNGVQAVSEIQTGQNVTIEADQNFFTRSWAAKSVDTNAAISSVNPSSTTDTVVTPEPVVTSTDTVVTPVADVTATEAVSTSSVTTDATADSAAMAGTTAPESISDVTTAAESATDLRETSSSVPTVDSTETSVYADPSDGVTTRAAEEVDDVHPAGTTAVESVSHAGATESTSTTDDSTVQTTTV